jgi:TatD DNase family protein
LSRQCLTRKCGLDYYREDGLDKALQHDYFSAQIALALRHDKPLIVHTRAAREDTIAHLKNHGKGQARGVLHCFTETLSMAKAALDMGLYLSFSGVVTFKNAESIREVVRYAPLDRVLVETDSPYLAPVPFRGKTNQPAYVVEVAKKVAEIKQQSFELVCETTFKNTQDLFGWPL